MANNLIDLTGQKFGYLTVLNRHDSVGKPKWRCLCECGVISIHRGTSLKGYRDTISCGCIKLRREPAPVGKIFGRWLVVGNPTARGAHNSWVCQCECGATKEVSVSSLKQGVSQGCGCNRSELTIANNTTHGATGTAEFHIWNAMKRRVKADSRYVQLGVQVCERWEKSLENFIEDMGQRPSNKHSIDRIDNLGNYEPGNCRWATAKTQSVNRRHVQLHTINGESRTLGDWCKQFDIGYPGAYFRLKKPGATIESALRLK